ncbi:exonuclease 1-like isoform X2 [Leptopilina boulardi]|nr:exonuclease 1-like isoform X2 [Leptopilina boulardi]
MTSQESIGSCSLDVDQSASDPSEKTVDSLSEKTLHSFNLSFNGEQTPSADNLRNGNSENQQLKHATTNGKSSNVNNGHHYNEIDQLTVKKPSYLGLSCSISGYSGITRYDSKLREGFRSRDSSPGARLITREASPVGFRSNENLNIPSNKGFPSKSQSISPLAMDRQNGFTNGTKNNGKIEKYHDNKSSINCEGYSEVDKGISLNSTYSEISPIRNNVTTKRSPGSIHVASYNQQNISYSSSSPKSTTVHVTNTSFSETSLINGSSQNFDNHLLNSSSSSEKSFIEQRVERLYGPGALAQGFFFKRSSFNKSNTSDSSFNNKSINHDNNTSIDNSNTEESLPVLKRLPSEFRAQLPAVHTRKPTDGSEQITKSLQRLSVATVKNEAKEKSPVSEEVEKKDLKNNSLQLSSSTTSITDQQPAAPQVVLPVLDSSNSKQDIEEEKEQGKKEEKEEVIEIEKAVIEKNGHYFMKLLKEERDKLILLAESAENELSNVDPSILPEEAAGKLRSASGKARLLASQKMQQFEGLCHKNINKVEGEEFPTKNEDLEGFWDMLMLQVIQVNELFQQIERSKKSQWQEIVPEKRLITGTPLNGSTPKRRMTPAPKMKATPASEANKKAREAREQSRRQMIEDRRRAMKSMNKNENNSVEIFIPET